MIERGGIDDAAPFGDARRRGQGDGGGGGCLIHYCSVANNRGGLDVTTTAYYFINRPASRRLKLKAQRINTFGNTQETHKRRAAICAASAVASCCFLEQFIQTPSLIDGLNDRVRIFSCRQQRGVGGVRFERAGHFSINSHGFIGLDDQGTAIGGTQVNMRTRCCYQHITFEHWITDV